MRIPAVRERVKIEGQTGTFLLVWVDQETMTVKVGPLVEGHEVLSVPVRKVQPLLTDGEAGRGITG